MQWEISKKSKNFKKSKYTKKHKVLTSLNLNSNRIINLGNLKHHLTTISEHAATCQSPCTIPEEKRIVLTGETNKAGLASTLVSICTGCNKQFKFPTSTKTTGTSGGQYWTCNLAAVWGQMVTGNGYAPLSDSMSVMGISTMTKAAFISAEQRIGSWWWELLQESMKIAGEEERALAIANNSYHQGVPAITVIVDGGWCKRTHRHTYNAKSGVGIIIGNKQAKFYS